VDVITHAKRCCWLGSLCGREAAGNKGLAVEQPPGLNRQLQSVKVSKVQYCRAKEQRSKGAKEQRKGGGA
jgi:hypothetical protein